MNLKEKRVRLTKTSAIKFGDEHPNGINPGYVKEGYAISDLEIGDSFIVACNYKLFYTSTVQKIDEQAMTFETENSVYKLEILPDLNLQQHGN